MEDINSDETTKNIVKSLSEKYDFDFIEAMEHLKICNEELDKKEEKNIPELFNKITSLVKDNITKEKLTSYMTKSGNTQTTERSVITDIKEIFDNNNISYEEAGSQQSKDFRKVYGIDGFDIEIKKTDTTNIYFNDTCPNSGIYYIVFVTGAKNKKIKPQLLFINGEEFVKDSPWIYEYQRKIDKLKDKYARGENKQKLSGIMSVYPRPTYKADIRSFLDVS